HSDFTHCPSRAHPNSSTPAGARGDTRASAAAADRGRHGSTSHESPPPKTGSRPPAQAAGGACVFPATGRRARKGPEGAAPTAARSEEHTSELQSREKL